MGGRGKSWNSESEWSYRWVLKSRCGMQEEEEEGPKF